MEDIGTVFRGSLFKKARKRSKWIVLETFIDRPWSVRYCELHKQKRCLKYFEGKVQKGEINLRGLHAKLMPSLDDAEHQNVFVICDATGLEVMTLSAGTVAISEAWVEQLNAAAAGNTIDKRILSSQTSSSSLLNSKHDFASVRSMVSEEIITHGDNFFREFSLHSFTSGSRSDEEDEGDQIIAAKVNADPYKKPSTARVSSAGKYLDGDDDSEETTLPHGVSLACLLLLRQVVREMDPLMTVWQVCQRVILPITETFDRSFASILKSKEWYRSSLNRLTNANRLVIDGICTSGETFYRSKADVFVSYCSNYLFVDLVDVLERVSTEQLGKSDASNVSFWVDILCENQCKSDLTLSSWWEVEYPSIIRTIQHTLLVALPVIPVSSESSTGAVSESSQEILGNESHKSDEAEATVGFFDVLNRTWCLWELLCSLRFDCRLSIAVDKIDFEIAEEENLTVDSDPIELNLFQTIAKAIHHIHFNSSLCRNYSSKMRILEAVSHSYGALGMLGLSMATLDLREEMMEWLLTLFLGRIQQCFIPVEPNSSLGEDEFKSYLGLISTLWELAEFKHAATIAMVALGRIGNSQTKSDLERKLMLEAILVSIAGCSSRIPSMDGRQFGLSTALRIAKERHQLLGSQHPDTIRSLNTLVALTLNQGAIERDRAIVDQCKLFILEHQYMLLTASATESQGSSLSVDKRQLAASTINAEGRVNFALALFALQLPLQASSLLKKLYHQQLQSKSILTTNLDYVVINNIACLLRWYGNVSGAIDILKLAVADILPLEQMDTKDRTLFLLSGDQLASALSRTNAAVGLAILHNYYLLSNSDLTEEMQVNLLVCCVQFSARLFGLNDGKTQALVATVGLAMSQSQHFVEAERLLRMHWQWNARTFGKHEPRTLRAQLLLAKVLVDAGSSDDVLRAQRIIVEILDTVQVNVNYAADHSLILKCNFLLGIILYKLNKPTEAVAMLSRSNGKSLDKSVGSPTLDLTLLLHLLGRKASE